MGMVDFSKLWMYLGDLERELGAPQVVAHEESDLHRVFCDEHFCLERDGRQLEAGHLRELAQKMSPKLSG